MTSTGDRARPRLWAALGLFAASLTLYLSGVPASITWEHDSADGPELAAAVATWGVPHPPGYPTYVLSGRLFLALIPVGEPALRLGIMSAFYAALAVALTFFLALELLGATAPPARAAWPASRDLAAALAAVSLAISPLLWSQAVVIEVYSLDAAFTAGIALLLVRWAKRAEVGAAIGPEANPGTSRLLVAAGLLLGLGLGNHLTLAALLPAIVFLGARAARRSPAARGAALAALAAMAAGLCVYAYLPLAAARRPPIDWGHPATLDGFSWTVSGTPYWRLAFGLAPDRLPARAASFVILLFRQLGAAGTAVAALGLWRLGTRRRDLFSLTLLPFVLTFAYAVAYRAADAHVYLLPCVVVLAGWEAVGLAWLAGDALPRMSSTRASHPRWPLAVLVGGLLALAGARLAADGPRLSLRGDERAHGWAEAVLGRVAPRAVIMTHGDRHVFALWYHLHALGTRRDVVVVSTSLLQFDWYPEVLRSAHPDLVPPRLPRSYRDRVLTLVDHVMARRPVYSAGGDPFLDRTYRAGGGDEVRRLEPRER